MKKLTTLIGAGMILFSGCRYFLPPIPKDVGNNPQEFMDWMSENITYVREPEGEDYHQTPKETLEWRTGDCEDFGSLMEYFIEHKLGGEAEIIIIDNGDDTYHAVVEYEDRWYDPILNTSYPINSFEVWEE